MKSLFLFVIAVSFVATAWANIRLPGFFGNHMVLQRDKVVPVWGWSAPGETVEVWFHNQTKKTKADKRGQWKISLNPETAGGPYQLTVTGANRITLTDVLIGDVWICSGQSNMEMNVGSSANAEQEIQSANFPQIRHIKIPNAISGTPESDIASGAWQVASPETVGNFTGVGYFFARKVHQETGVPIGLINASWGGTMIETWISGEALNGHAEFKNSLQKISFEDIEARNEKLFQTLMQEIESTEGKPTAAASPAVWKEPAFDHTDWKKIALPVAFDQRGLAKFDGTIWFRKTVTLTGDAVLDGATLNLGTIDDFDEAYINGIKVGGSNAYNVVRQYAVPRGALREGANTIALRVTDNIGNGGFFGKPVDLNLTYKNGIAPLAGDWFYKIESLKKASVNPNSYPSLLFNAMIHPLLPAGIRGVLWYQGESNASRAYQYRAAMPVLIRDWRAQFKQGDFPFYFVQLASFNSNNGNSNKGSTWAELREAQTQTLALPNTGMAVTLDIGETSDIHPKNKQDVGGRLAAIALHHVYGKGTPYSGPVFQAMRTEGAKAILTFSNAGSGFSIKDPYGYIKGFEVAGADKKFYFAKAHIEKGSVVVYSDSVTAPVAVRYGWADDMPDANLYNREGFPAVPFRTDAWPGITTNEKYVVSY